MTKEYIIELKDKYESHWGKKMEIRSISYPIDDVFYYLSCDGCKRQEPEFHLAIDAYLDWFNKCNNEESK